MTIRRHRDLRPVLLIGVLLGACGATQEGASQSGLGREDEARAMAVRRSRCAELELESVHVEDLQGFQLPVYTFRGCETAVHVVCDDDECAVARLSCPSFEPDDPMHPEGGRLHVRPPEEEQPALDLSNGAYELEDADCFYLLDEAD